MSVIAAQIPIFADLANISDLSVLAALIREDGLDAKAGWDMKWVLDASGYKVAVVPVAHQTETLVAYTNGSICAGGVSLTPAPFVAKTGRQTEDKKQFDPLRTQRSKAGPSASAQPIQVAP